MRLLVYKYSNILMRSLINNFVGLNDKALLTEVQATAFIEMRYDD
jgi:hypothetical protein